MHAAVLVVICIDQLVRTITLWQSSEKCTGTSLEESWARDNKENNYDNYVIQTHF